MDYLDGEFVSPTERITEELTVQFQGLNAFFLRQGSNHLGGLNKVVNDPDTAAMQAKDLLGRLEKLKTIGREIDEELQEIVDAWLDEQAGKAHEAGGGS